MLKLRNYLTIGKLVALYLTHQKTNDWKVQTCLLSFKLNLIEHLFQLKMLFISNSNIFMHLKRTAAMQMQTAICTNINNVHQNPWQCFSNNFSRQNKPLCFDWIKKRFYILLGWATTYNFITTFRATIKFDKQFKILNILCLRLQFITRTYYSLRLHDAF